MNNIIGQKFGRLTLIKEVEKIKGRRRYLCKCDCGTEKIIYKANLKVGGTKSCGCLRNEVLSKRKQDLTGQHFGLLLVLHEAEPIKNKPRWSCKCDCGEEKIFYETNLKSGLTTSCGCSRYDDRPKTRWTNEEKEELLKLYESGLSNEEISLKMGRSLSAVSYRLLRVRNTTQKIWTKEEESKILKMLDSGMSRKEISKIIGRTISAIDTRLKMIRK